MKKTKDSLLSRQEKIGSFDPEGVLQKGSLFGLPFDQEESGVIIIPVPWEATVSFGTGTAAAPRAIMEASSQIDFFDADFPDAWEKGIFMLPVKKEWEALGKLTRKKAMKLIKFLEDGNPLPSDEKKLSAWKEIDANFKKINEEIKTESSINLQKKKIVGILGGDHSVSLGLIEALSEIHDSFGILQIDAHLDLRDSYEGFQYSHASAMRRAMEIEAVSKIVNIGARDYSQEEIDFSDESKGRSVVCSDRKLQEEFYVGNNWHNICRDIVTVLPQKVYISFDIDGLEHSLCPSTGTPVPGGLTFEQVFYLLKMIMKSDRRIIGFDLTEVAPGTTDPKNYASDWDANVGARALYRLAIAALSSKK